jgi:hypothetical protein
MVKVEVTNSVFGSKRFPPVFEVADIMSMPNDSQGISFIKPNQDFCAVTQFFMHRFVTSRVQAKLLLINSERGEEYLT